MPTSCLYEYVHTVRFIKKSYPCDGLITYNVNAAVRIGTGREKTIINKRVERALAS